MTAAEPPGAAAGGAGGELAGSRPQAGPVYHVRGRLLGTKTTELVKESLPLHDPAPGTVKRAGRRLALAVLPLLVAGCAPQAVTTEGRATHDAYNVFLIAAACVFGVVAVWLLWSVVAYRRRNDELPAQISGSNKLELLWTAIPLALVLFLFVVTVRAQHTVLSDPPTRVTIDVTAFQWSWQFDYGLYHGQCAQYCGVAHSDMLFRVKVVSQDEFERFLTSGRGGAPTGGGT